MHIDELLTFILSDFYCENPQEKLGFNLEFFKGVYT